MKKLISAAILGLSLVSLNAMAHGGAKPQHGGIVQSARDLSFELVPQENGAAIYVVDHDAPADVNKASGKLTVLNGAEKSEATLSSTGANKLEAKDIKLTKGSKVVATLTGFGDKTITVRFTVK
ncbi:hypothetical protein [Giesbergeria anulus]|uniref:Copper binding protein CusF n=1 Tax=Giesbergeria anulus TaxID=180197 RepID=A0A1H9PWN9_9BURK|nr:hypothetical protein [Giesbergeria anulus]SER52570.1 hypothetical protein SAMN02982919_02547 [Giesbergeria anulus]